MSSQESSTEETPALREAIKTVTPGYHSRPDTEMNAIGLAYAVLLAVLVIPLLPFIALVWLLTRGVHVIRESFTGEEPSADDRSGGRGRDGPAA